MATETSDKTAGEIPGKRLQFKQGTNQFIDDHLQSIRIKIEDKAVELLKDQKISEQMAVAKAIEEFAPGDTFPADKPPKIYFWNRILESFSGITLVSAILAIIFGLFGLFGGQTDAASQRWLDVAKIFAGAVVGSAGATAVSRK